jgi:hypothetical protein
VRGGGSPPSRSIFVRPFPKDEGRNNVDDVRGESSSTCSMGSDPLSTAVVVAGGRVMLNTSPGPPPPPNTRWGAGSKGTFCFGAGSMDNSEDFPAPDSSRCFFAAGRSSASSSLSFNRDGSPIVIFLGPRLGLGSKGILFEASTEADGRETVDFFNAALEGDGN